MWSKTWSKLPYFETLGFFAPTVPVKPKILRRKIVMRLFTRLNTPEGTRRKKKGKEGGKKGKEAVNQGTASDCKHQPASDKI